MDWIEDIIDRLSGPGDISSRAVFGGHGIYERQTLKSDYEVPPGVLTVHEALLSWAGEAIRAGQNLCT
jgi:DNA transformation protein and related proteins